MNGCKILKEQIQRRRKVINEKAIMKYDRGKQGNTEISMKTHKRGEKTRKSLVRKGKKWKDQLQGGVKII